MLARVTCLFADNIYRKRQRNRKKLLNLHVIECDFLILDVDF